MKKPSDLDEVLPLDHVTIDPYDSYLCWCPSCRALIELGRELQPYPYVCDECNCRFKLSENYEVN